MIDRPTGVEDSALSPSTTRCGDCAIVVLLGLRCALVCDVLLIVFFQEAVNKVMKDRQHEIMGKFVEVKRAEPRDARSSDRGGDRGGHGGDRDDMYGGMGMYGGRYASMYGGPMRYPYGYGAPGRGGAPGGAAAAAAAAPGQYPGFGAMGYYGGFPAAYR